MADSEAMYVLKKQLRKMAELSGSGTELVSVYIPKGYPIHETGNRLREEINQAGNIKSKTTRNNVIGALERIIAHLKLFKQTPPNGMVVFAGNISDNPSKTDIQLFSLEPPQPLSVSVYRCDNRFFLDPLQRMLDATDSYGIVVMDGREATVAILKGTQTVIIKKLNSTAHAKIRKGGQCLAAGSLVIRENGEIAEIEKLAEESSVMGIDFSSSRSIPAVVSDFFVTPAKHSLVIETEAPKLEIRATPYHRFFVLSEHGIKEKFAKNLAPGDRLIVARRIRCRGGRPKLRFEPRTRILLDEGGRSMFREARLKAGLSQQKAARMLGVSQMLISHLETGKQTPSDGNLMRISRFYGLEPPPARRVLKMPEAWNENIARLFGVICGDGTLDGNRIIIYEGNDGLAKSYCRLVERSTGIEPVLREVNKVGQKGSFAKKRYFEVRIYSLDFANAVIEAAPEIVAAERDIPGDVAKCEDSIVAAFLSGLYDAEGYLHGNRVEIAMTSRKVMQKVQLLLMRFGILSSFGEKKVKGNRQWYVSISDRGSVAGFRDNIGFAREDKKKKLERICGGKTGQQYADQIPMDGRMVYALAKQAGLKTSDFHAASCFFRNKKPLGRTAFARNILPVFERKKNPRCAEIFRFLQAVYDSDITTANLKAKTEMQNQEKFYDMTIPTHSNFIANGFVVHNSARRYERLIEESIEKYYQRVGAAMDDAFLGRVKGIIIGGPGPTKEFFYKAAPYNYQHKILGVVDTGYTEEYGVREAIAKSESLIQEQEAVKERIIVERFIKGVINEGLATYGEKEVRAAIESKKADLVLLSEGLGYEKITWKCSNCGNEESRTVEGAHEESLACPKCGGKMQISEQEPLIEELEDLAKEKGIKVEIISQNTAEGAQFLQGFTGIGAFLRYR
ncbi:MAG: LAGLIDADG family homing endonuclease [Candidatus ainarchaeum sp.]|nr:LAGLIDADG family homing endonuclease [Candidatus ainarchaeum sp.]